MRTRRPATLGLLLMPAARAWVTPTGVKPARQRSVTRRWLRITPSEEERPEYGKPREIDESLLGDLTGGRPGAIIETEEQLALKEQIMQEVNDGTRSYPDWFYEEYNEPTEEEQSEFDVDDPTAIDASTLGTWTIQDIRSQFDYEWDASAADAATQDPNILELNQEGVQYVEETEKDDDGVEVGYNPIYGPSNPIDRRTIKGAKESFMTDQRTRNDDMLPPLYFNDDDPEAETHEEVVEFRRSLDIIETYVDEFLGDEVEVPRHVAKVRP